jgi:hypothetical protein
MFGKKLSLKLYVHLKYRDINAPHPFLSSGPKTFVALQYSLFSWNMDLMIFIYD